MIFFFNLGDVQVPAVDFQTCIRLVPVIIHGFAMVLPMLANPSSNLNGEVCSH